jgi:hypothetical protein
MSIGAFFYFGVLYWLWDTIGRIGRIGRKRE